MEQTFKNGTKCKFSFKDYNDEDFWLNSNVIGLGNKKCTIISLATYTQLGNKDFEYYNIKFDNGIYLNAISGYHLTIIE